MIIAKCGFNHNTKPLIIFGPSSLGGSSFRHLYTEQGVNQILAFLLYRRTNLQPSTLCRIATQWVQHRCPLPHHQIHHYEPSGNSVPNYFMHLPRCQRRISSLSNRRIFQLDNCPLRWNTSCPLLRPCLWVQTILISRRMLQYVIHDPIPDSPLTLLWD